MSIIDQVSEALKPHTTALGRTMKSGSDQASQLLMNLLVEMQENNRLTAEGNRPQFHTRWAYFNVPAAIQAGSTDFPIIAQVPKNEIWQLQAIIAAGATTVSATTDGGQLRGAFTATNAGVATIGGDIVWLPGEHIVFTNTAAVAATFAVIRQLIPAEPRAAVPISSNEMVSGRSNTHDPNRDNLGDKGIYTVIPGEVRPSEGSWEDTEPHAVGTYDSTLVDPTSV